MHTDNKSKRRSLRYRQTLTVALMFGGYAALYFCRADLSVGAPLIIDELKLRGVEHGDAVIRLGSITSLGVLAYALGKLFLGGLGDFWGGRVSFLIGLSGATIFTLMFATGSFLPVSDGARCFTWRPELPASCSSSTSFCCVSRVSMPVLSRRKPIHSISSPPPRRRREGCAIS